jgi:hypothetical protein
MTEPDDSGVLTRAWQLPYSARMGSSVRSKGLFLQVRSQLPKARQKALSVKAGELTLQMPRGEEAAFAATAAIIEKALTGIESRPVIPREIEDILGITSTERRRWLEDGRLPSAGTRTVKLRGRGTITFHVFDPGFVEDALNRDIVVEWREQDAEAAAERRRRAAWAARRRRKEATQPKSGEDDGPGLIGWAEFEKTGLLR